MSLSSWRLLTALVSIAVSACAVNGFDKFYTPVPGVAALKTNPSIERSTGEPAIYAYSNDPQADNLRAWEEGYVPIGTASFYGPSRNMTRAQLISQAEKEGAAMVIMRSQYKDTISGVVPYTVANPPQVSTVNTTGTVNAFGSGGYATGNYSGQSTITSPGDTLSTLFPTP